MSIASPMRYLTAEQMFQVHEATLHVLENTGIEFHHDEALQLLKRHGAKVNGTKVCLPRKLVERCLASCPSTFTQRGMNQDRTITWGAPHELLIGPHYGDAFIVDYDGTRRSTTMADCIKAVKLYQASPVLQVSGMNLCEPQDVDTKIRPYELIKMNFQHSDKPFMSYNMLTTAERANRYLDMLELGLGKLEQKNPGVGISICSSSPLRYEPSGIVPLMEFARRGQIIYTTPAPMIGATSPVDLLGSAVLQNAECLAAIVLTQLVHPGCPVVYGVCGLASSLKSAKSAWGSPESLMMCGVDTQLAAEIYHLPTRVSAGITTSPRMDFQAILETTQSLLMGALSGVHMIYNALGALEDVVSISLEKIIFDEEIVSRTICIQRGVPFSRELLDEKLIDEVGCGGLYLTHDSTMRKFRQRWTPLVSDWDGAEGLEPDIYVRAHQIVEQRLAEQEESLADEALIQECDQYIATMKAKA